MDYSQQFAASQLRKLKIKKVSYGITWLLFSAFFFALGEWYFYLAAVFLGMAGIGSFIQAYNGDI